MPITFIITAKRANLETDWFTESSEFTDYINKTYIETGKCLQWRAQDVSDDQLTMTLTSIWTNRETLLECTNDYRVIYNQMDLTEYSRNRGTVVTIEDPSL
jgi:hypothetical protein